nr:MAG TPA: hypothetical protein [Caudoviricetes sp.]
MFPRATHTYNCADDNGEDCDDGDEGEHGSSFL